MVTLLFIGMLTFTFNIRPVKSDLTWTETIYVRADGSVDPDTAPIQRDGNVYTFAGNITDSIVIETDNIIIDGSGYTLEGVGTGNGFDLSNRYNVTIRKTHIERFGWGILLYKSTYNNIIWNKVSNSQSGIVLFFSNNSTISNNRITDNKFSGIYLDRSNYSILHDNTITGNRDGFDLRYSSDNTIRRNTITTSSFGIDFVYSNNNTITANSILDNNWQVIMHPSADGYANVWDDGYPSGGNYWSDYTGDDFYSGTSQNEPSSDGIGDNPYVIDASNIDHYPLMNPWVVTPPPSYTLTIYSSPSGVTFTVDALFYTTPWSGTYNEGASASLVMLETYDGYVWSHWLEDGDTNRTKTVTMNTNVTLTAVFTPDTTPPIISILSPENKTYHANDVPLTFTGTESTSWIGYSLNGQPNVTITGNTTLPELSDGMHSLVVYAEDTAGNTGFSEVVYFSVNTQQEPFPIWIVAVIVIIAAFGTAVYLLKIRRTS